MLTFKLFSPCNFSCICIYDKRMCVWLYSEGLERNPMIILSKSNYNNQLIILSNYGWLLLYVCMLICRPFYFYSLLISLSSECTLSACMVLLCNTVQLPSLLFLYIRSLSILVSPFLLLSLPSHYSFPFSLYSFLSLSIWLIQVHSTAPPSSAHTGNCLNAKNCG